MRSRWASFFDGQVIDRPAVRSLDDLKSAGREAFARGFRALKTNVLVFDDRGGGQYTPGSARGDGHPELNLPEHIVEALIAQLTALCQGAGPQVRLIVDGRGLRAHAGLWARAGRALSRPGICPLEPGGAVAGNAESMRAAATCSFPRPACGACGERATRAEQQPNLGLVRGGFHKLRLAVTPPHPDLLPACGASGEKETALQR
jgi:hypothetical protein